MADLDAGFQRPKSPQDVPIAYFQASQVCEFIAERYGFDAILRMLAMYRDKARTPDVLQQVLKLSENDFDREFAAYIEAKVKPLQQALSTQANVVASLSKAEVLKALTTQDTFALRIRALSCWPPMATRRPPSLITFARSSSFRMSPARAIRTSRSRSCSNKKAIARRRRRLLEGLVKTDENNLEALKTIARFVSRSANATALDACRRASSSARLITSCTRRR
jgi:hypothetical protein